GSPKVCSRAAAARDRVRGSVASTDLTIANVRPIRAASRALRRDPRYARANRRAAQRRADSRALRSGALLEEVGCSATGTPRPARSDCGPRNIEEIAELASR